MGKEYVLPIVRIEYDYEHAVPLLGKNLRKRN